MRTDKKKSFLGKHKHESMSLNIIIEQLSVYSNAISAKLNKKLKKIGIKNTRINKEITK